MVVSCQSVAHVNLQEYGNVDGVQEAISNVNPVGIDTVGGRNVWIGDGHHNRPFPSVIDDVSLYNHAMTQAEILVAMEDSEGYPYALGPEPDDGAFLEDTWMNLSWSPGDFAVSHDVYIGDNFNDVNNATGGFPQGSATFTPGPLKWPKLTTGVLINLILLKRTKVMYGILLPRVQLEILSRLKVI